MQSLAGPRAHSPISSHLLTGVTSSIKTTAVGPLLEREWSCASDAVLTLYSVLPKYDAQNDDAWRGRIYPGSSRNINVACALPAYW